MFARESDNGIVRPPVSSIGPILNKGILACHLGIGCLSSEKRKLRVNSAPITELILESRLNIRSVVSIYRTLNTFLEQYDEQVQNGQTPSVRIDADFRSGVYLGMGMSLLVFSMIPSRIVIVSGVFPCPATLNNYCLVCGLAWLQR